MGRSQKDKSLIARRKRGTGTVKRLTSGRWVACWPRWIDPKQRNIWSGFSPPLGDAPTKGTYETREDAQDALDKAVERYRNREITLSHLIESPQVQQTASTRTVHDAVRAYIDSAPEPGQPGSLAVDTISSIESALRRHIDNPDYGIGHRLQVELTQSDLYDWWKLMEEKIQLSSNNNGTGLTTRKRVLAYVRAALSEEVKRGTISSNPAIGLSLGSSRKSQVVDRQEIPIPPLSRQWRLIASIPREGDRLFALALMWGGARFSELAGARLDSLDAGTCSIRLDGQWKRQKTSESRRPTWIRERLKTGRARNMRLPRPLFEAIQDWRHHRRPTPPSGRQDVLFPYIAQSGETRQGTGVWTASNWSSEIIHPHRAAAGLDTFTEKQWRAGCASLWEDAGFRQSDIQRQLGHRPGSQVTALHYLKALEDERDTAREKIRNNPNLTPQQRLDALYESWVKQNGAPIVGGTSRFTADDSLANEVSSEASRDQPSARR